MTSSRDYRQPSGHKTSNGTTTMNGNHPSRHSKGTEPGPGLETAPMRLPATDVANGEERNKTMAEIREMTQLETESILRWRRLSVLSLCVTTALMLVALIVESVRISEDNNSNNHLQTGYFRTSNSVSHYWFLEEKGWTMDDSLVALSS